MRRTTETTRDSNGLRAASSNANDLVRKLDHLNNNASSISQLFTSEASDARKCLLEQWQAKVAATTTTSIDGHSSQKSEETAWRKCYHSIVTAYKRFKKNITEDEITLLKSHFVGGLGFYRGILDILNTKYDLKVERLAIGSGLYRGYLSDVKPGPTEQLIQQVLYRNLIYLGDLCRYLSDLSASSGQQWREASKHWYSVSLVCVPESGLPYNQLGTLSADSNYGLDSAYFYMRSLCSEQPFEGSKNNLILLLRDAAANTVQAKPPARKPNQSNESSKNLTRNCITNFLKLAAGYWIGINNSSPENVSRQVEEFLVSFKDALPLPPGHATPASPSYLDNIIVFRMGATIMMLLDRADARKEENPTLLGATNALAINFFLILIESAVGNLESYLDEWASSLGTNSGSNVDSDSESDTALPDSPDGSLRKRRPLSRFRRKKKAVAAEDIDTNFNNFNDDDESDFSDLEETVLSTIDALDIESDYDKSDNESEDSKFSKNSSSGEEGKPEILLNGSRNFGEPSNGGTGCSKNKQMPSEEILKYLYSDLPFPTLKIFCDWFAVKPQLFKLCADPSCAIIFSGLVKLLNILLRVEKEALTQQPKLTDLKKAIRDGDEVWHQKHPSNCDWALHCFRPLKSFQEATVDFSLTSLDDHSTAFICVERIISFGFTLGKQVPSLGWDASTEKFALSEQLNASLPTTPRNENSRSLNAVDADSNSEDRPLSASQRKQEEAVRLARQYLKSEVKQLEKDVKGGFKTAMPPYLVVDATAFCSNLKSVTELMKSGKFIVVIPKIVLSQLDELKKTMGTAREAIRWLETEAQKGARFLKFQKEHEKLSLGHYKYPPKKDRDAFEFYQLLESCNYIRNQTANNKEDIELVTLLTSASNSYPQNAGALSEGLGIKIGFVENFLSKLKKHPRKPKKKQKKS